jgi:hypothetical protein
MRVVVAVDLLLLAVVLDPLLLHGEHNAVLRGTRLVGSSTNREIVRI